MRNSQSIQSQLRRKKNIIFDSYFFQQDSKLDSYLDDDGESDHGAAASDISQASSVHSSGMTADGMVVTKV